MYLKARIILLCIIAGSFTTSLVAQKIKVTWGDNSRLNYDFDDAIPLRNGNYLILKLKNTTASIFSRPVSEPSLVLVNSNMVTLKEAAIQIDEREAELKGLEKYGDNIFFIYNSYDRKSKVTSVYALRIDEKTLLSKGKVTLGNFESDSRDDQAEPTYKLSADSSKILLFVEGPERKKENKKYFVGVYDTDLKNIWLRNIELPIGDRYVSIYDEDITNDGKVFVAIKHYDKEVTRQMVREEGEKVPSYTYKLLKYAEDQSKAQEISFNLNDNFIQGTKLVYNNNGTITAAGLYKRKYNGNITGVFYATFDGSATEVKDPTMVAFPGDMLTLVDKDNFGTDSKSDAGLYPHFKVNYILNRTNGSVDLISEYYRLVISSSYNSQTKTYSTRRIYYYGDIVNVNLGKDGTATFTRVPKNQKMQEVDIFLGYFPIIYKDKLVLLYNDDEDNIDRDLSKAPDDMMRFKKSVFAAATIDAKGNLTRQTIYSHRDEDYVSMPRYTSRISDSRYLITSDLLKLFKKRTRFGILEIK